MEIIALTDKAASHFRKAIDKSDTPSYLRIGLIPGGCAGFKYALGLAKTTEADDMLVESNGISIVIDAQQVALLEGTTIDIEETLEGAALKINNPNFNRSCGCGKSVG